MLLMEATEEYALALKAGQKEYRECLQRKQDPNPLVLEDILDPDAVETSVDVGLVNIPMSRIVGTKTAGRISAFTPSFRPLLEKESEFAAKWISLCVDHLGDTGIQNPIECYEYYGNFYVQEGNKRVSVLSHFGAPRIAANVKRIMPPKDESPRYKAYLEFLEFYKLTGLYEVQFTLPGNYAKLLLAMGYSADQVWTEEDRRRFRANFYYFTKALDEIGGRNLPKPEDALLMWLQMHNFDDLKELSGAELKKSITQLGPNLAAAATPETLVKTEPQEEKGGIVQRLKSVDHLTVAFIHQYAADISPWTRAHETGRKYLKKALGKAVTTRLYQNANTPEKAEAAIDQAVREGADVIFTTTPQLIGASMKGSVKYPKVRFLNCSVPQPYASVRTYYSRVYEGKFITGAIAGAMSKDDRIGYVGNYPIHGVAASINAFALGAQMTNPNAKIVLKWSCLPGNPTQELLDEGIRVISNRDTPVDDQLIMEFGTYIADAEGQLKSLGSPCWIWGPFYEHVVRNIISGNWDSEKAGQSVNLWWGMSSGVVDVILSEELPEGVRVMAQMLKKGICDGTIDPFARKIIDQQGNVRCDGSTALTPMELLQMDWLCDSVVGDFPEYEDIQPISRAMVDLLGVEQSKDKAGVL